MNVIELLKKIWRRSFQAALVLVILGGAIFLASILIVSKPKLPKAERKAVTTPVVTMLAVPTTEKIVVTAFGTVQEERRLNVQPEVSGRVVSLSPNLVAGGILSEDEEILRIDPRDYKTAVAQESAAVTSAELELKLEEGRRIVAEREWELLDPSITKDDANPVTTELGRELALRKPQSAQRKAALDAARSRLEKAQLDLERTTLRSPFQSLVLDERVEVGQIVSPSTTVATLLATERFWVKVSVPIQQLQWIRVANTNGEDGASATVSLDMGPGATVRHTGQVLRVLGDVDSKGRMARLIVAVNDPLQLDLPPQQRKQLLVGSYVQVEIDGPEIEDIFRIPREALRQGDQLWVKTLDDRLEIRDVVVLYRYTNDVLVGEGLTYGDRVILSTLPVPVSGMHVRELDERND